MIPHPIRDAIKSAVAHYDNWVQSVVSVMGRQPRTSYMDDLRASVHGPDYDAFGRAVHALIRDDANWFQSEWSTDIMPLAVEAGLAHEAPYDPDEHGVLEAEPGDHVYIWEPVEAFEDLPYLYPHWVQSDRQCNQCRIPLRETAWWDDPPSSGGTRIGMRYQCTDCGFELTE